MSSFTDYLNGNNGQALQSENQTIDTLVASITYGAAAFGGQFLLFMLLRLRLSRIYHPRTYLVPERERVPEPPRGVVGWLKPVFATPSLAFIQKCGLDAYFFLRYLRMLLKIFLPIALVILPILLPINRYSGNGSQYGLNVLSISNVAPKYTANRLWAHLILAIVVILWVCYVVFKELRGYIRVRQAYLTSPQHRIRASATTVLVTGIPKKWLTLEALDGLYDVFPGGIRNIWINRNFDELADKVHLRDKMAESLESAETDLIKKCREAHEKKVKKGLADPVNAQKSRGRSADSRDEHIAMHQMQRVSSDNTLNDTGSKHKERAPSPPSKTPTKTIKQDAGKDLKTNPNQAISDSKWAGKLTFWKDSYGEMEEKEVYRGAIKAGYDQDKDEEDAAWRKYIEPKDRDTMRLPLINQTWFPTVPFVGKKVDKIYYCRKELARLNMEVELDQENVENYPFMNSAFIQFNHQVAAHMACQSLNHHVPLHMAPRQLEISPNDVLWDNMSMKWWERYIRTAIVLAVAFGLIILYAVPVTFSSSLNRISSVAASISWLAWLRNLPGPVISIIQGILPPILLSILLFIVPIIFRALVKLQGVSTGNARELGVQQWYFVFLFIQVFFIVTLSGGLISFFSDIAHNPSSIPETLAQNLPKAANYFFSYITLQALSSSASGLIQAATLAIWFLLAPLLDSTPRQKWRRQTDLQNIQWGSFFPPFTNFAVIGLIYSVIAPLILVFMLVVFGLFWIVYRYNVLFVYQFKNDTGGLLFPTAINQLFTGLYVLELCLIGFFFIARNQNGNVSTIPQAVIMIVVLVLTVSYQVLLNSAFRPLFQFLPITLEDDAVIRDEEFARAQASKWESPREEQTGVDIQDVLQERERQEEEADRAAEELELRDISEHRRSHTPGTPGTGGASKNHLWQGEAKVGTWKTDRFRNLAKPETFRKALHEAPQKAVTGLREVAEVTRLYEDRPANADTNVEAQRTVGDLLYANIADELEDLTPDERDILVRYAFQHSALRAKKPVVWIPRDPLGVSEDEIRRVRHQSKYVWMSDDGTKLDGKGKVTFQRSPPDFSNVDLIAL